MAREQFEQASQPAEPSKKRGLKRFILPAVLGASALVAGPKSAEERAENQEKPAQFELGPLSTTFVAKERVSGARMILRVGQQHGFGQLFLEDADQEGKAFGVESQKDIEKLIDYCYARYGLNVIFVEGLDVGKKRRSIYDNVSEWDGFFRKALATENISWAYSLIYDFICYNQQNVAEHPEDEGMRAKHEYLLLLRLRKIEPILSHWAEQYVRQPADCPTSYRTFFEEQERGHKSALNVRDEIKGLLEFFENDPLIKGDNVYSMVGGAWKRYLEGEGKFELRAADDHEARLEMLRLFRQLPHRELTPEEEAIFYAQLRPLAQKREDAAIKAMADWMAETGNAISLDVIGDNHRLRGNVLAYNRLVGVNKAIGLTELQAFSVRKMREKRKLPSFGLINVEEDRDPNDPEDNVVPGNK